MRREVVVAVCVVGFGGLARADDVVALRSGIRDASEAKAVEAAQKLAKDASAQAMEATLDELSLGAPPKVEAELLAGLTLHKDPRTFDVLSHYAHNRNAVLRKRAITALAELQDPRIPAMLLAALADPVSDVRAAAARAIVSRKERSPQVEDALVKLLAHKDDSAVEALGLLGGPMTARRIGELKGDVPDGLLANTFKTMLGRPDFGPEPLRLDIIRALGNLTGAESTAALQEYVKATEQEKDRPSSREARRLIELRGVHQK